MGFQVHFYFLVGILVFVCNSVSCNDLKTTDIKTVNDSNRYRTLNPGAVFTQFSKRNHAKGNVIFSSGQRIDGDHLILTKMDETQYTRLTDVEVSMWYPATGQNGDNIISYVEIITILSSDGDAYFVNGGGIGSTFAEILLTSDQTDAFGYQIYLYGY